MIERVLIDSSAWIASIRVRGSRHVKEAIRELISADVACTCPVVLSELLQGARSAQEFTEIEEGFKALVSIPVDEGDWIAAARLGFELRRKGLSIPLTDLLIASVAIRSGCRLLHLDKHFDALSRYSPLRTLTVAR